jgi:hypothetical protein
VLDFDSEITFAPLHHKSGSEHNFVVAGLSAELSAFLNCDLTLIYLLQRGGAKAQKGVGAENLLEIGVKFGYSRRVYCLNSY